MDSIKSMKMEMVKFSFLQLNKKTLFRRKTNKEL